MGFAMHHLPTCAFALLSLACATPVAPRGAAPVDAGELERLVDDVLGREMERQHVPGAAFAFVQGGRVVLLKGYGVSSVATGRAVDPERTIWRIGSISKVFTADAVMQLAERGEIALDGDLNRYLRRLVVPEAFGRPVTPAQLLTHTAGFDELRPGTQAPSRADVLPLAEFLATRLEPISPPGAVIAYSTYGMTLAGALVEEVSAQPYELYLREHVWRPLGMTRTCIDVPEAWSDEVAVGYEWEDGAQVPQPWEWYHTTPASSINSTAADMALWLLAHLGQEPSGGAALMNAASRDDMLRQHATGHPRIAGFAYGWNENLEPGYPRFLDHGGNVAGFSAEALIVPERGAGFFLVSHGERANLRDPLKWAILERFFRAPEAPVAPPRPAEAPAEPLARFAGRYGWNIWCHTCPGRTPDIVIAVAANADGTLAFNGHSWIQVEPLYFVRDDGRAHVAFAADAAGAITHLFSGGFWVFERLP
jgi:CubicO group peptidase (beta-lactamase class C family)